jgi:RNA polymerase sigma-70 factor (ECF subfamily)
LTDDDHRLVERVLRDRDEGAFRELYGRHTPALYLLALRLLGRRASHAEDVIQDVWVRATRNLGAFAWSSTLRTWLSGIAVNRCREVVRGGMREERAMALWVDRSGTTTQWTPDTLALERAIAGLPDGCREVLVLHDIYGHTHTEVAAMLGIAVGTSKSQLHDARCAVRAELGIHPAHGVKAHERR